LAACNALVAVMAGKASLATSLPGNCSDVAPRDFKRWRGNWTLGHCPLGSAVLKGWPMPLLEKPLKAR